MKAISALIPFLTLAAASPLFPFPPQQPEPKLETPEADLRKGITCYGVEIEDLKNPLLFQHGTGLTGNQSFQYNLVKDVQAWGYQPCIVDSPVVLLEDAQVSVEYLVYAIRTLSRKAPGGKIPLFTWSLGGPLAQWAFTFWPSTQNQVKNAFLLAPDMRGANFAAIAQNPLIGEPSLYQQYPNSTWLKALAKHGGLTAKVPTTVQYSLNDEIVQPESGPDASSPLGGSRALVENIITQDICANISYGHFTGLSHAITADLFKKHLASAPVRLASADRSLCNKKCNTPTVTEDDCSKAGGIPEFLGNYFAARGAYPISLGEPALRDYAK